MNATELNRLIFDEIYKLRAGKSKPERTNAVARMAGAAISNARLQLMHAKMVGGSSAVGYFGKKPIEGNAKRIPDQSKAKVLQLKKKAA